MREKIMTLDELHSSPGLWINITRGDDVELMSNDQGRYLEIRNSTIGVTLLHRKTFQVVALPEKHSQPLMISRGSKYNGRVPRDIVAYLIPVEFTGEQFEKFKEQHRELG